MKKLLLDVDGVILDYTNQVDKYVLDIFGLKNINGNWNLATRYEISSEFAKGIMLSFENSIYFQRLPPIEYSVDYLKMLRREGYSIRCVTKVSQNTNTVNNRRINLINAFGDIFNDIIHVGITGSKKEYFTDPDEIFIEDSFSNLLEAKKCGYNKLIYIPNGINNVSIHEIDEAKIKYTSNWIEIYKTIQNLSNG